MMGLSLVSIVTASPTEWKQARKQAPERRFFSLLMTMMSQRRLTR